MDFPKTEPSFSETISAGVQTYHLEIKKTKEGRTYLDFQERRENETNPAKRRIVILDEYLPQISEAFQKALVSLDLKPKSHDVEEIRQTFPRAYQPWTADEEEKLRSQFLDGSSPDELAADLGRQPGAIRSRLTRLGLL